MTIDPRELCEALMHADTANAVEEILELSGYAEDGDHWRYYGDSQNNYATVGNQQANPISALAEKITNAIDARLINECLLRGIDPESPSAPQSPREAVAVFFENQNLPVPDYAGRYSAWTAGEVTSQAKNITITATGPRGKHMPSITIADTGEGQEPSLFPSTLLSLGQTNKFCIPFVQGKFNMGGTGVLPYCAQNRGYQLIVSRRNQLLSQTSDHRAGEWGFTLVRRQEPVGNMRSSIYTYLAPIDISCERKGGVLSFAAETFPILPESLDMRPRAYSRLGKHGTLVKLYEYDLQGYKSNIIQSGGGLRYKLEASLPDPALPVRMYEARVFEGKRGSFETNMLGAVARLSNDKNDNLEPSFPQRGIIQLEGRRLPVVIFATKNTNPFSTRPSAIVFSVEGQGHGALSRDFYGRSNVGMSVLAKYLWAMIDCSDMERGMRENLFMPSRDRLRSSTLKSALEAQLERFLKSNDALRELRNRRIQRDITTSIMSDKPLSDAMRDIVSRSPELTRLLRHGPHVPAPFNVTGKRSRATGASFVGKATPTYFRFKDREYGTRLERDAHVQSDIHLLFETDAADNYLTRHANPAIDIVETSWNDESTWRPVLNYQLHPLHKGRVTLRLPGPDIGHLNQTQNIRLTVVDEALVAPFVNVAALRVRGPQASGPSGTKATPKPNELTPGNGVEPSYLTLPNVRPIRRDEWKNHSLEWTDRSAVQLVQVDADTENSSHYDYWVNLHNTFLIDFKKRHPQDPQYWEYAYTWFMVMLSVAIVGQAYRNKSQPEDSDDNCSLVYPSNIEDQVRSYSETIAPFLLPTFEAIRLSLRDQ